MLLLAVLYLVLSMARPRYPSSVSLGMFAEDEEGSWVVTWLVDASAVLG